MVQFKKGMRGLTSFANGAVALYGCGEDEAELSNNDLLIGEWNLISLGGESYFEESDSATYALGFKFEADGDLGYCYEYTNEFDATLNESYCDFNGEWEWVTDEQNSIRLTQTYTYNGITEEDVTIMQVRLLTEDRLEGDFLQDNGDDPYSFVFVRYDFDD